MASIDQNRQAGQAAIESGKLVPSHPPSATSVPIPVADYPASPNPYARGPLPASYVQQPDMQRQWQTPAIPQSRIPPPSPIQNPTIGASASSNSITIVQSGAALGIRTNNQIVSTPQGYINFQNTSGASWSADAQGDITLTVAATGDGLTHGDPVWEYDSAYVLLRDEFPNVFNATTDGTNIATQIGELGWGCLNTGGVTTAQNTSDHFPYLGSFSWDNSSTAGASGGYIINGTVVSNGGMPQIAWPLLDYPGWKLTFVWKIDSSTQRTWSTAKKNIYVGLCGNFIANLLSAVNVGGRPDTFIGVRFDTSATPGTLTLSSVATSSGGNAVYTGTITGGANGAYNGLSFVVSGFTNSVNNGTFVCVASSTTTLTLANPSAVAENHAATAANSGIQDTHYTFECVSNRTYTSGTPRHNLQGQTFVTSLVPTQGVWYRLEITCVAVGQVTISMTDGSQTISQNFTIPQLTILTNGASTGSASISSVGTSTNIGIVFIVPLSAGASVLTNASLAPFGPGSKVTFANFPGSAAVLNGQTVTLYPNAEANNRNLTFNTGLSTFGTTNLASNSSITGYPAYQPYFAFGNDDTSGPSGSTMRFFIDYFSFVWNPNLGPSAPGTPNSVKPRYW